MLFGDDKETMPETENSESPQFERIRDQRDLPSNFREESELGLSGGSSFVRTEAPDSSLRDPEELQVGR
jgi:hypothetical protein